MKKFLYFLLATIALSFASCRNDQEPGTEGKEDPKTDEFQSIVELDDAGLLKSFPFPYMDFQNPHCLDALKKWEAEHGSKLAMEKVPEDTKQMILVYDSQDPNLLNATRKYFVKDSGNGSLYIVFYDIKRGLVFEETDGHPLTDRMESLLQKEGFTFISTLETGELAYENSSKGVMLTIAYNDNGYADLSMILTPSSAPAAQPFHANLKDFPYMDKKLHEEGIVEAIKQYENQLGLRQLSKESEELLEFKAKDPSKTNFQMVRYQIKETTLSNGKTSTPNIFVTSLSLNGSDMDKEEVQAWLTLNGATNIKKMGDGIYSFDTEKYLAMSMYVSDLSSTSIIFNPKAEVTPDPETPGDHRFVLPFFFFGEEMTENCNTMLKEKERGGDVALDLEQIVGLRNIRVFMPIGDNEIGTSSIYYYENYMNDEGAKPTIEEIVMEVSRNFDNDGENKNLIKFLNEKGFEFKNVMDDNGTKKYYYLNSKEGVEAYGSYSNFSQRFEIWFYKVDSSTDSKKVFNKKAQQVRYKQMRRARK